MRINPGYVNGDKYQGPIRPVHPNHCTECTRENSSCEYHGRLNMVPTAKLPTLDVYDGNYGDDDPADYGVED